MSDENVHLEVEDAAENSAQAVPAAVPGFKVAAPVDAVYADGLTLGVVAGRNATASDSAAGSIVAGADLNFSDGAAGVAVVGGNAAFEDSLTMTAVVGGQAQLTNSACGVLIAGNVNLGEGSRVLLNTQQAVVFGAALGAVLGLVSWLLRRRS